MVTIATTLFTNSPVNMGDTNLIPFASNLTATATKFSWLSGFGSANAVHIHGSDFSYSGSGDGRQLAGGTISRIVIDRGNDNGSETAGDLVITGTEGLVAANIRNNDRQDFWSEILKGDDTFNLFGLGEVDVGLGSNAVFGDDFSCLSGPSSKTDTGGNDNMFGADNTLTMFGDVNLVLGAIGGDFIIPATYTGGNDLISGATSDQRNNLVGDAGSVGRFGELIGGNDVIDGSRNSNATTSVTGDVDNLDENAFVRGGADSISLGTAGVGTGDVLFMRGAGSFVIGGDDTIDGRKLDCAGDVFNVGSTVSNATIQGGSDRIIGAALADRISGDILNRQSISNTVTGGVDVLRGAAGNDQLFGEVGAGSLANVVGGNDRLFGGSGDDGLFGQAGSDQLTGGTGGDQLDGGAGVDTAVYGQSTSGVAVNLTRGLGFSGDAQGDTLAGIEQLFGSDFADMLIGDTSVNVLSAGAGSDVLDGRAGRDILAGGTQADRFVFIDQVHSRVGAFRDVINDFVQAQLDRIDVSQIDARASTAGNNAFSQFIGSAAFTAEGQIRAAQSGANTIVEFNSSGTSGGDMQVLLNDFTAANLKLGDFIL